jgi:adenylosuccinate lyase
MLSPIDSRYYSKVEVLSDYFSEFALVKARLKVEVEYLIRFWKEIQFTPELQNEDIHYFKELVDQFSTDDFMEIQNTEKTLNHDVKSVEVFLRQRVEARFNPKASELVHFGMTSQDVNDVAIPYLLKTALEQVIIPEITSVAETLTEMSEKFRSVVMIARTHGQPASPTGLGKEFRVFLSRLTTELEQLKQYELTGKFGGATGNLNAHILAYPDTDWVQFSKTLLSEAFSLKRSEHTTQINNFESKSRVFDSLSRICGILQDLSQDMWLYLMMGFLTLETKSSEVGSSAMPHKVNPIDFENAEGNLQYASSIFTFLSRKLLVSRLQRDLTDYTLKRNIGVPMGHLLLSLKKLNTGLGKIKPHYDNIQKDLRANHVVVAEGIQTLLRREGVDRAYDRVKEIVRGTGISAKDLDDWLKTIDVPEAIKTEMRNLTPEQYAGSSTW